MGLGGFIPSLSSLPGPGSGSWSLTGNTDVPGMFFPRRGEIPAPEIALLVPPRWGIRLQMWILEASGGLWREAGLCQGAAAECSCAIPNNLESPGMCSEPEAGFNLSPGAPHSLPRGSGKANHSELGAFPALPGSALWPGLGFATGGGWDNPREIPPGSDQNQTRPKAAAGPGLAHTESSGWNPPCPSWGRLCPRSRRWCGNRSPFVLQTKASGLAAPPRCLRALTHTGGWDSKQNTPRCLCRQEETAPAPGSSQGLVWERWEPAGRSLGCASAGTFPSSRDPVSFLLCHLPLKQGPCPFPSLSPSPRRGQGCTPGAPRW